MPRRIIALTLVLAGFAWGCTPSYDWREARFPPTPLQALVPCKPVQESRKVSIAGEEVELVMASCKAGSTVVAIGHVMLRSPDRLQPTLDHWERATLVSIQAKDVMTHNAPLGSSGVVARTVQANGVASDGKPVKMHGRWFGRDRVAYLAMMVGESTPSDAIETFGANLRLP
jgi:hypothetical protein